MPCHPILSTPTTLDVVDNAHASLTCGYCLSAAPLLYLATGAAAARATGAAPHVHCCSPAAVCTPTAGGEMHAYRMLHACIICVCVCVTVRVLRHTNIQDGYGTLHMIPSKLTVHLHVGRAVLIIWQHHMSIWDMTHHVP